MGREARARGRHNEALAGRLALTVDLLGALVARQPGDEPGGIKDAERAAPAGKRVHLTPLADGSGLQVQIVTVEVVQAGGIDRGVSHG